MLLFNDQPDSATVTYAVGESRLSKAWATVTSSWAEFRTKCETFKDTGETMAEYDAMERDQQGRIKDCGGFVGGILTGGRRDKRSVQCRYMICLDFDHVDAPWDTFIAAVRRALEGKAWVAYTTHKHREGATRARLVVPVAQPILPENYEPVARALCSKVGIDWADSTTYAAERLMYWPTRSADAPWHAEHQDGEAATQTWCLAGTGVVVSDPATWPRGANDDQSYSPRMEGKGNGNLPDPTQKDGIVGLFNRAHWPLSEALEELLPGLYLKGSSRNRYTWSEGSTSDGAIIYGDSSGQKPDCYLWSTHDTDPAKGMHNIFDLVRIHKHGHKDANANPDTPMCKLPSYLAMVAQAKADPKVKALIAEANKKAVEDMVDAIGNPDATNEPKKLPKYDNTIEGAEAAIAALLPNLWRDEFDGKAKVDGDLPWRKSPYRGEWTDEDMPVLRRYLEPMGVKSRPIIDDGFENVLMSRRRDSLRDWLESLVWDGNPRIAGGVGVDGVYRKQMLSRWLGAADNEMNKIIAKAFMVGLAKRGMARDEEQNDYTLALLGPEGIGKTSFCRILGGKFFTSCALDLDSKDTLLTIHKSWLIEFAEIVSFKKVTVEVLKGFLTRIADDFRKPYGDTSNTHFRRCAFVATTNDPKFINSENGMRQLWPVECSDSPDREDMSTMRQEAEQIIAEAVHMAKSGEHNWMTKEEEKQMKELQKIHNIQEDDSLKPELEEFLEKGIPAAWERMGRKDRKAYSFKNIEEIKIVRNKFYAAEFVDEVYGFMPGTPSYKQMVRKVNKLMEEIGGWEKHAVRVSDYGLQKGWMRTSASEPSEGDFVDSLL